LTVIIKLRVYNEDRTAQEKQVMPFFDQNKNILLTHYPRLFEVISAKDEDDFSPEVLKIDAAQAGDPVLSINGMHIHSPRDPAREGRRLAEAVSAEKGAVVLLGFGLGYAAQAAAELKRPVIVVEKHKSVLLKALELRDFSDFLGKHRIIFVIGGNGEGITSALSIANELIDVENENKKTPPSIIRNRALTGLDEQWYKKIDDRIRAWSMRDDVNTATHKRFGQRWVRNLSRNMSAIRDIPGVSCLSGLALNNDLPVFLAAAGPGLDKITPLLQDIYERCLIVAVDTSLRFFIKNGIEPDFTLVVDSQFWNCRHLDRCVPNSKEIKTALVAESAVYPPVFNLPFKKRFLCSSMFPLGGFIEKQVDPKGRLGAGGSVATTAWDFARTLGATEIWIAGLDLAFPGLKTHFRGARFEERSNSESNRFNPVEKWIVRMLRDGIPFKARSSCGGQVLTDRRLSLYAAWFESQFSANKQIQNYCFSQDGLAISGLQPADMKKFLALPKRREEIDSRIQQAFLKIENVFYAEQEKQQRRERYEKAVSNLNNGLKNIQTLCEQGMQIAHSALKQSPDPSHQSKILKEMEEISRQLVQNEFKEITDFLTPLIEDEKEEDKPINDNSYISQLKSYLKYFTALVKAAQLNLIVD